MAYYRGFASGAAEKHFVTLQTDLLSEVEGLATVHLGEWFRLLLTEPLVSSWGNHNHLQ